MIKSLVWYQIRGIKWDRMFMFGWTMPLIMPHCTKCLHKLSFLWYKYCLKWECSVCSEFNWLMSIALGQECRIRQSCCSGHERHIYVISFPKAVSWAEVEYSCITQSAVRFTSHLNLRKVLALESLSRSDCVWITERVSVTDPLDIQHNVALSSYTSCIWRHNKYLWCVKDTPIQKCAMVTIDFLQNTIFYTVLNVC